MTRKQQTSDGQSDVVHDAYAYQAVTYANTIWIVTKQIEIYKEVDPESVPQLVELEERLADLEEFLEKLYVDWVKEGGTPDEDLKIVSKKAQADMVKMELGNLERQRQNQIISARINTSISATKNAKIITANKNEAIRLEKHVEAFKKLKATYV